MFIRCPVSSGYSEIRRSLLLRLTIPTGLYFYLFIGFVVQNEMHLNGLWSDGSLMLLRDLQDTIVQGSGEAGHGCAVLQGSLVLGEASLQLSNYLGTFRTRTNQ